jgi:hypothetical protein
MRQILQYPIAHPDAKDTLEGILKWWLESHPNELDKDQVQEALDALVSKEWLVKRVLPASQEPYSFNLVQVKVDQG